MSRFVDTLSLLALAGVLATASGCSLRYDPDDLGDDGADDDDDDGSNVGPDELFVERVFPPLVREGEGVAIDPDESVRAIPIVLFGQNMTADTTFSLSGDGIENQEVAAQVSSDGTWAAFELRLPIVPDNAGTRDVDLLIRVSNGDETREVELTQRLLPEFRRASDDEINTDDPPFDEGGIVEFSRVELNGGTIRVTGEAPFRVVAYGGISVSGVLDASGGGPEPGAGGCEGAGAQMEADCGPGSGGAGDFGTLGSVGGGGGGFGSVGQNGAGAQGAFGRGGMANGDPSLVPMPPADGAPAGGGGGVGLGGGSGGIVELTTPGVLALSGRVRASGASGECNAQVGGVGGGGGSGGAILVRAGGLAERISATLEAIGGPEVDCAAAGGAGGDGRIRIDLPPLPEGASVSTETSAAFSGPAFDTAAIPTVSAESALQLTIQGAPESMYVLSISSPDGATDAERTKPGIMVETGSEGVGETTVELWEGFNQLCLQAVPSADPDSYPEAANCLTVAYISP
jgi:hypothetical protein